MSDPQDFVRANTVLSAPSLVPEIMLHLASEVVPLWHMTEEELNQAYVAPPYWAFAWAGGQALSRHLLDHSNLVAGKRVVDFASGSGLGAIAAAKAGAVHVLASDIDTFACAAIALNAKANGVSLDIRPDDIIGREDLGEEVLLAGDVCYEQPMADRVTAWLVARARAGVLVLVGDPGRTYLPRQGLEPLGLYQVATSRELEDRDIRATRVYRVMPDKG